MHSLSIPCISNYLVVNVCGSSQSSCKLRQDQDYYFSSQSYQHGGSLEVFSKCLSKINALTDINSNRVCPRFCKHRWTGGTIYVWRLQKISKILS